MTVKDSPVAAEGRMVLPREETPKPNPPGKNELDRPPPAASSRAPGRPITRARDSPSPIGGALGRSVPATRRRVRPAARVAWAALRAESAGVRGVDLAMTMAPAGGQLMVQLQPNHSVGRSSCDGPEEAGADKRPRYAKSCHPQSVLRGPRGSPHWPGNGGKQATSLARREAPKWLWLRDDLALEGESSVEVESSQVPYV